MFKHVWVLLFVSLFTVDAEIPLNAGSRPKDGLVPRPPREFAARALASVSVSEDYWTQYVDNFNSSDSRTYKQRYQVNTEFYHTGGPMFVLIGGESALDIGWMQYGQWYKNARDYGALMLQPEHRFYGVSQPTSDTSVANLKYLTSEQALADLDVFIKAMITKYKTGKVIVFGGSYPGNLAAFYKEKYTTAVGSVASSAPVTGEANFTQYLETVGYTMDYFTNGCANQMSQAIASLQQLFNNKNMTAIRKLFKLCSPGTLNPSDPYAVNTFFYYLRFPWMNAVQYSAPDEAHAKVASWCKMLMDPSVGKSPLERLSATYQSYPDLWGCVNYDYQMVLKLFSQSSWTANIVQSGGRQWMWQSCNEFGYFESTDSKNQPFGQTVPLSYLEDLYCTRLFGISASQIDKNVANFNSYYGGTSGKEKDTYFSNGSLDPWHSLGIYRPPAPDTSDTIGYINGTSHCYDMQGDNPLTDPKELTDVRNQISVQIGKWLGVVPPTGPPSSAARLTSLPIFAIIVLFAKILNVY